MLCTSPERDQDFVLVFRERKGTKMLISFQIKVKSTILQISERKVFLKYREVEINQTSPSDSEADSEASD